MSEEYAPQDRPNLVHGKSAESFWSPGPHGAPTLFIIGVLFLGLLGSLYSYGKGFSGLDFYQFWVVPHAYDQGEVVSKYAELPTRQALGGEILSNTSIRFGLARARSL